MLTIEALGSLLKSHSDAAAAVVAPFSIAGRTFHFGRSPALMGVVNLSADSWYRESVWLSLDAALRRARVLAAQGADLIDVGAESTLPHAARADEGTQSSRVVPFVQILRSEGILVSVETYDTRVARNVLRAGAALINLTGSADSADIYREIAAHDAGVIICCVQGANVRDVVDFDLEADPILACRDYFARELDKANAAGLTKIFLDPGLGFYYRNLQDSAARVRHQMTVFLNSFRLRTLGYPICHALPHAFEYFGEEVRSAEGFFAVLAALGKTDLFRTHEVPRVRAVLDTMGAYPQPP